MNLSELYYPKFAAAFTRGEAIQSNLALPPSLTQKNLDELSEEEIENILEAGKAAELKLYRFKNTHNELPRVKRVLGFLKSTEMESLLDVGSGRGVFLWPFLSLFPGVDVMSLDLLPHRVNMLKTVIQGGVTNLHALEGDICTLPLSDKSYDIVTMLEVLEHITDTSAAIRAAVRISRKYIVVTVPSKPDNNPEHIHMLTKEILTEQFYQAGCERLHFDGVPGHLFMVAILEDKL